LKKKGETVRNRRPGFDTDLVHLEFAIRRNENVRLVVIDSLPALCPDKKAYRQTLRRLEEIARRRNVAIVATARPSTRSRGQPKVEGDKLSEEVRSLFHVLCDPEDVPVRRGSPDPAEEADRRSPRASGDLRSAHVARSGDRPQSLGDRPQPQRRFLAPVRMNFCEEPEWLAFRIVSGVLAWETPTDGPPLSSCIASPTRQKAVRLHEAMNWLREMLKDENQPAAQMNRKASGLGFAAITVRRACDRLGIRHIRCEFGPVGLWMWALPTPDEEELTEVSHDIDNCSHKKTPPGPPLRRGGMARSAPRTPLRSGGRSAAVGSANLPDDDPADAGSRTRESSDEGSHKSSLSRRRPEFSRIQLPKAEASDGERRKNHRRKGPEPDPAVHPAVAELADHSQFNAVCRKLFVQALRDVGGIERSEASPRGVPKRSLGTRDGRQLSNGRPRKPR
jgi:hypothetical protein